jgi:predicted protein tyrosine phosphatase
LEETVTKQIIVQSANKARHFESTVPWACISIASEEDEWPDISEANRVGLLQLAFADMRFPDEASQNKMFCEEHAHKILSFVKEVWDRVEVLLVHCEAGMCRSPAVAAAISRIYFGEDKPFFLPNLYEPNPAVYRILMETAIRRGDYPPSA